MPSRDHRVPRSPNLIGHRRDLLAHGRGSRDRDTGPAAVRTHALFWNEARSEVALAAWFTSLNTGLPFNPFDAATMQRGAYGRMIDVAGDGLRQAGGFGQVKRLAFDWQVDVPGDAYAEQLSTSGG